jgi:acyl-CoA dehydrogenase
MDFELPDELRMFKESLRRFVNNELIPVERQTVAVEGEEIKPEFLEKFRQRAKDLGIWMMEVPEEFGGAGLSLVQGTLVTEELSRTIALPARGEGITGPSVRHILYQLTGDLKEKYLMPVLRGE